MKLGPTDVRWSVDDDTGDPKLFTGRFHFIVFVNDRMIVERQPGLAWINTCSKRVNRAIAWLGGWR